MYTFDTIRDTRAFYCVEGAASWAKNAASGDVMQAITVWNMINASVAGLIWRSPFDYTDLGNVLSPAFETMPLLHSVELGFTDRTAITSVTRRKGASVRGSWSSVQSSSPDCYLMGIDGCAGQGDTSEGSRGIEKIEEIARKTRDKNVFIYHGAEGSWKRFASKLRLTPQGGVFYWWTKPAIVVEEAPDNGGPSFLSPAIQLAFKAAFPAHERSECFDIIVAQKTVQRCLPLKTEIMGRITLKLAALGGGRLTDKRLGDDGNIYLCDATGSILAAKEPKDVLTVTDGVVRFKYIWEVEKKAAKGSLREAFTGSSIKTTEVDEDGTFIAVEGLDPPLARFAIVVVSRNWASFQSNALIGTAAAAAIVSPTPYLIIIGMAVIFVCGQCVSTMIKNDGNVGQDSSKGRVSIAATMARTTVRHTPVADEEEKAPKNKLFASLSQRFSFLRRSRK